MNVAIILRRIDVRGGTQRLALELAKYLKSRGHRVTFYTLRFAPEKAHDGFIDFNVVSSEAPVAGFFSTFGSVGAFIEEAREAKRLAKLISPETELLNPHDQVSYKVAYYAKKKHAGVPSVWTMNDMPTRKASFEREHEVNPDITRGVLKQLLHMFLDWFDVGFFIKAQDEISVLDHRDQQWVARDYHKTATVVRTGVTVPKEKIRARSIVPAKPHLLLFAHVQPHRRFEDVVKAAAILKKEQKPFTLTIAGKESDPSYSEYIKKLVIDEGLSNEVRFVNGNLSDDDVEKLYAEADVFLNPSHFQSWGIAVFEAMGRGVPVIVSNTIGASEVLKEGETGLIVEAKKPEAIAAALRKLFGGNEMYARLSRAGIEFVAQSITWEGYGETMLRLFEKAQKK